MRVVAQRMKSCSILVKEQMVSQTGFGLLCYVGISHDDGQDDISWMADKVLNLRIFNDQQGIMNHSVLDVQGELCLVSQFTLLADARKGRRPSYSLAAKPEKALILYHDFINEVKKSKLGVQTGIFQADMSITSVIDGPVTILIDSKKTF